MITRAAAQAGELTDAIRDAGYEPVSLPLLAITDPPDRGEALRNALEGLGGGDWLAVLSPNGARAVLDAGRPAGGCRIAVVGEGTASVLRAAGIEPDLVPGQMTAAGLSDELLPAGPARIVIAQAEGGRPTLADGLARFGWDVTVVPAYANIVPDIDAASMSRAREADVVVFASPSAVDRYADAVGTRPDLALCIGPVTGQAARDRGFDVRISPAPSVAALVAALGDIVISG